jgi:hypothetical protein
MAIGEDHAELAQESRGLVAIAPQASIRAAALLREVVPRLSGDKQRAIAKEMAHRFEQRAIQSSRSSST